MMDDATVDIEWMEDVIFRRLLDYGEKGLLERSIEIHRFTEGETIIEQGATAKGLFFLKKGAVLLYVDDDNERVCVGELATGAQLGDMAMFEGVKTSATVIAANDCEAYFLPKTSVIHLMTFRRELARDIMMKTIRQLSASIRHMNQFNAQAHHFIHEHVS